MLRISTTGGISIAMALCLLLVCQTLHASRRLWSIGVKTAGWDWGLAVAVLMVAYRNLLIEQVNLELAHSTIVAVFILGLLLLAGAALAVFAPRSPDQWRSAMAIGHEASILPVALVGLAIINDPRVYPFVVMTVMLCFLPAIVDGRVEPAPILAFLGTAPILTLPETAYSRAALMSLIASVAVSGLLVVVTEGLGDRAVGGTPTPETSTAPSGIRPRIVALRLALAAIVFNLAVLAPMLAGGLVGRSQSAWAALHMVPGLVSIAFILLGAFSSAFFLAFEMAGATALPSSAKAFANSASRSRGSGCGRIPEGMSSPVNFCQSPERLKMATTASVGWAPTDSQYWARSELTRIKDGSFLGW